MGIKASIWGLYRGSAANPYFTNKKTNKMKELSKYRPKHAVLDSDGWFDPTESETRIGIINKTIKDIEASIASTLESD